MTIGATCHADFLHQIVLFLCTSGGAELLFDGVKEHHVTLPGQSEPCEYPNLSLAKVESYPIRV